MYLSYSIGADPEWFLKSRTTGKPVSAIGKIGGTKDDPQPLKGILMKGFAIQEDNVALEYNIPPCSSVDEWVDTHVAAWNAIEEHYLKPLKLQRFIVPSHSFAEEELADPRSWVFGCEPDFDAWALRINPRPASADPFLRSAGGQIHVGCDGLSKLEKLELVRVLDAFISLPLMLKDRDTNRRQLYGNPGAMRFKPYGLEYRTPSNYWTKSKGLVQNVAKNLGNAFLAYKKGIVITDEVRHTILADDVTNAKTLMERYDVNGI